VIFGRTSEALPTAVPFVEAERESCSDGALIVRLQCR
jgi:hypothetical protein